MTRLAGLNSNTLELHLMPLRDLETWMWTEACQMLDRADQLHRQFFRPVSVKAGQPNWEPPIDIYQTAYGFTIMIALPGVSPEHLSVMLEHDHLIISGRRSHSACAESHILRLEIPYGRFERRIELPAGLFEISTCELTNGCLLISLRKT
jgi:HSP20 family protein